MRSNTIILSREFQARYPRAATEIEGAAQLAGLKLFWLPTRNIWCRDFMPVQVSPQKWVKFSYRGYGSAGEGLKSYPWLRVGPCTWSLPLEGRKVIRSRIVLDGGNVVWSPDRKVAVLTEIIFRHNPDIPKVKLVCKLEKLLEAEIVLLPVEPGDDIGHTDGILHFVPGGQETRSVVLNDYARVGTRAYDAYARKLSKLLGDRDWSWSYIPNAYGKRPHITEHAFRKQFPMGDTFNPGFGYYVNFLRIAPDPLTFRPGLVLVPQFGIPEDAEALEVVRRAFPEKSGPWPLHIIRTVDCSRLSLEGGLVNCVTCDYAL